MNKNPLMVLISAVAVIVLVAGTCSAGFAGGYFFAQGGNVVGEMPSVPQSNQGDESTAEPEVLFQPFWEAWDVIHEYYVDQPVDDLALMRGAIRGMVDALDDQHTSYLDPVEYKDLTSDLSGEYEGIGALVTTDSEFLTIVEPFKGSPAEGAGLIAGDKIIAVDGEDVTGVLPELVRQRVLGPKGSEVILTILREGVEEPFDVSIIRASIIVPTVESEMLEGNVAYIKLRSFSATSAQDIEEQISALLEEEPVGLILDLRNNGGGLLTAAVEITSQFVEDGVVVYEQIGDGTLETNAVIKGGIATDIPMVILVNEFSASASEVLAGALQDYDRAQLVGVTTFGKGTVQVSIPLNDDEGAVKVTIARWLTPDQRQIHEVGLEPDVVVERTQEDIESGRDPQLDKAVEILTGVAK
jgi:carboxyl-terminal processing protease